MTAFFIVSCARSGSTSLANILDTATNGTCVVEPEPTLSVESRLAMEGRLDDPDDVVARLVAPRVEAGLAEHGVYGEKNVTYGPFVRALHEQTGGRFVFLRRDGRDVVRSLLDWHDRIFGTIYRECADPGALTPRAVAAAAALPAHLDTSDYARPRPRPGTALADRWETMSRLEMCAYYWSTVNDLYRRELAALPPDRWVEIDYTRVSAADVMRIADFCGLEGLREADVETLLDARINSAADRGEHGPGHAHWRDWDGGQRRRFEEVAGETMRALGYFGDRPTRWRPTGFGVCWHEHAEDLDWYEWMHDGRRAMHEEAVAWIRARDAAGDAIESVADFGCGLGVGYCDALADRRYEGFDLCVESIEWCRRNRSQARHAYHHLDFVAERTRDQYDLVMSSGTIDNGYDVEAFLDAMLRAARKWIYVTCYRGWFPDLSEHRYTWNADHGCFYADLAPARVRDFLESRGATDITIEPRPTGRDDIPNETRIIARVPAGGTTCP